MSYRSGTLSIQPEKERKVKCNRNFPQEISKKIEIPENAVPIVIDNF